MVSKAINSFSRVWTFVTMIKTIKFKQPSCTHTLMQKHGQLSGILQEILQLCDNVLYLLYTYNKYNLTAFFMILNNVTSKATGFSELQYSGANLEQCITPKVSCSDGLSSTFWSTTCNNKIPSHEHPDGTLHHYLICLFQK